MDRIEFESFRRVCPHFADKFVRGKAAQTLETSTIIVGVDERLQVSLELIVIAIMIAFSWQRMSNICVI